MKELVGRRNVLAGGLAAGALALGGKFRTASAQAKPTIIGVTWGGPWISAWKQATAKQSAVDVNWVLHEAATSAIVAKVKASWPNPLFDFINCTPATIYGMMREGWLEPLTPGAIPNLAHLAPELFIKDAAGQIVAAPLNTTSQFWIYDAEALGMKVGRPEDLLSPKVRGKLLLLPPIVGTAMHMVSFALARGGNEHNIDPGFEFVKDLVKAKMVARLAQTDVEVVNAFTTGEVAIGFVNSGNYNEIRKHKNVTLLDKVPHSTMFKNFVGMEGVVMLKRAGERKPVTDFINFVLDAPVDGPYATAIGCLPANELATAAPELEAQSLKNAQERHDFGYYPDRDYISKQLGAWTRKWELEIAPLLG